MNDVLLIVKNFENKYCEVLSFVKFMETEDGNKLYRENQEILYTGIINRIYGLWETFCKDLVYQYYIYMQQELVSNDNFVKNLNLKELPGYIYQTGRIENNHIYYCLNREILTYTSQNLRLNELKTLFKRYNIDIEVLPNKIKSYILENSAYFSGEGNSYELLDNALKILVDARNMVAHNSFIENYVSLETVECWIGLYKQLVYELGVIVFLQLKNNNKIECVNVGKVVNWLNKISVICTNVIQGAKINKNDVLVVFRGEKIHCFLKAVCFQVDDNYVDEVKENDKAGIKVEGLLCNQCNIHKDDILYVLPRI